MHCQKSIDLQRKAAKNSLKKDCLANGILKQNIFNNFFMNFHNCHFDNNWKEILIYLYSAKREPENILTAILRDIIDRNPHMGAKRSCLL